MLLLLHSNSFDFFQSRLHSADEESLFFKISTKDNIKKVLIQQYGIWILDEAVIISFVTFADILVKTICFVPVFYWCGSQLCNHKTSTLKQLILLTIETLVAGRQKKLSINLIIDHGIVKGQD